MPKTLSDLGVADTFNGGLPSTNVSGESCPLLPSPPIQPLTHLANSCPHLTSITLTQLSWNLTQPHRALTKLLTHLPLNLSLSLLTPCHVIVQSFITLTQDSSIYLIIFPSAPHSYSSSVIQSFSPIALLCHTVRFIPSSPILCLLPFLSYYHGE